VPALGLTDTQLAALRVTASALPLELRPALLELIAGYCEGEPDDVAFAAALDHALRSLDKMSADQLNPLPA
jgi:hypothetical protein